MKIAVIPARSGSKRLPDKNLLPLGQKPLIAHTIEAVVQSDCFDQVIVSSDDNRILDLAEGYKDIEAWQRPDYLADDTATVTQALSDVLEKLECVEGICGIFLPTSPFRHQKHINEAMNLLYPGVDSVISVSHFSAPIEFRMQFFQDQSLRLKIPEESPLIKGRTRSQEHEDFVHPNGAIYLSYINSYIEHNSFFSGNVCGYLMRKSESIDIDDYEDYKLAKSLLHISK